MLVERRNFWRRYYELEQEVAQNDLRDVRALLSTIPISEEESIAATLSINASERSLAGIGTLDTTVIVEWRGRVTRLMHQIDVALRYLEQQGPQIPFQHPGKLLYLRALLHSQLPLWLLSLM